MSTYATFSFFLFAVSLWWWACGGDFVTYRKKHVLGQVFFFFLVQLSFLRSLVICDFNDTIVYTWYEGVLLQKA